MRTYSQLLNRESIDEAEVLYRAQNNHIVFGRADHYVDAVRAIYPTRRYLTYRLHRLCTPGTITDPTYGWVAYATAHAIDPEVAFVHHAGVRRQLQDGSNWYVMNMGSAEYLAWARARTVSELAGTTYGDPAHTSGPMEGSDYDLCLWYPAFDATVPAVALAVDPLPRILDSDEYTGSGNLYQDQCKDDYLATKAAAGPGIMPNFGDISYAQAVDANTLAVVAGASVLRFEVCLRYDGGKLATPNADGALTRWAFIDTKTAAGKDVLGQGWLDHPGTATQAYKDQCIIGTAAFFLMADHAALYGRCVLDVSEPAGHISTWEKNDLMRVATERLGSPVGARVEVGSHTQGRLFQRDFSGGSVYIYVQKQGQSGNDTAVVTLADPFYPLGTDGSIDAAVTSLSLGIGDAAILWDGVTMALTIIATPGASDANSYLTEAEADTFFFYDPEYERWDRLDTASKRRHLVRATRDVDSELVGVKKLDDTLTAGVPAQALVIPRPDDTDGTTPYIPVAVKKATFEQLRVNITGSAAGFRATLQAQGVTKIVLGDGASEEYGSGSSSGGRGSSVLSPRAADILTAAGIVAISTGYG